MGEWDDLPWWAQRAYLEQLSDDQEVPVTYEQTGTSESGDGGIDPFADLSEFGHLGFTVGG